MLSCHFFDRTENLWLLLAKLLTLTYLQKSGTELLASLELNQQEEEHVHLEAALKEFEDQRKEDHREWQEKLKDFLDIMLRRSPHPPPT